MAFINTNEPTRYEVVLESEAERLLVQYTTQHSAAGLLAALRVPRIYEALLGKVGEGSEIQYLKGKRAYALSGGWTLRFSGRTQRDALATGELSWIVAAVAA